MTTTKEILEEMDRLVRDLPPTKPLPGGVITCDGNCHKPIERGGAKPCNCPCCQRYG